MIPAYARPAHRRLREKLARILEWNEAEGPNRETDGDRSLGIITSGISFMHAREAAPEAAVLKLGMTYPLPLETIRRFVDQRVALRGDRRRRSLPASKPFARRVWRSKGSRRRIALAN